MQFRFSSGLSDEENLPSFHPDRSDTRDGHPDSDFWGHFSIGVGFRGGRG